MSKCFNLKYEISLENKYLVQNNSFCVFILRDIIRKNKYKGKISPLLYAISYTNYLIDELKSNTLPKGKAILLVSLTLIDKQFYFNYSVSLRSSHSIWAWSHISVKFCIQLWLDELQLKIEKKAFIAYII